jgi:hypothetical protein
LSLVFFIIFLIIVVLQASTDQSSVDTNIPYRIGLFSFYVITLMGTIAVMSEVAWQVFIVFVPVIAGGNGGAKNTYSGGLLIFLYNI